MGVASNNVTYHFEAFRVDPAKRELWCNDELVPIQPKAFDCLVYLIEHRDRVVGRDELIATVWGKVSIADSVLGQIISRIRGVLGDSAARQSTIRTVTRVGYSWVKPVKVLSAETESSGSAAELETVSLPRAPEVPSVPDEEHDEAAPIVGQDALAPSHTAQPASSRRVLIGAVLVALAFLAVWWFFHTRSAADSPVEHDLSSGSTAIVLPVQVLPVHVPLEPGNAWVRLGVMDLIGERLRAAGLAVVPSDNVVALARDLPLDASDEQVADMAQVVSARMVLRSTAEPLAQGWRVAITSMHDQGRPLQAYGDGQTVIDAARVATDRLSILLDLQIDQDADSSITQAPHDHLLQQVRAAVLVDRLDEARALLGKSGADDDPRIQSELADIELRAGNYVVAERLFSQMLEQVPDHLDPVLRAQLLRGLSFTRIRQIRYADAWAPAEEAIALLETLAAKRIAHGPLGNALAMRAVLHRTRTDFAASEADYTRARILLESSGDQLALARLNANLASLLIDAGRIAEGDSLAQHALEQLSLFGDVQSELRLRTTLLQLYRNQLDAPRALAQANQFERLLVQIDNPDLEEFAILHRMDALIDSGLLQQADALAQQLLDKAAHRPRDVIKGIWAEFAVAWVALELGDARRAAHFSAIALAEHAQGKTYTPGNIARMWWVRYRSLTVLGDSRGADEAYAHAERWADNQGEYGQNGHRMMILRAEHAVRQGRHDEARELFERAWKDATQLTSPFRILEVAESYCDALFAQGDLQRATLIAGRTAAWAQTSFKAALLQTRLHHALGQTSAWRRALERSQAMAGERTIPAFLLVPPVSPGDPAG